MSLICRYLNRRRVLLYLVNNHLPMDGKIKRILNAVVVIAVVVWLLYAFGVLGRIATFEFRS